MPASERDRADADCVGAELPTTASAIDRATADELDSRTLFAATRRRTIVHQGERYCLQLTRAGKLLLTK